MIIGRSVIKGKSIDNAEILRYGRRRKRFPAHSIRDKENPYHP